MAGKKMGKNPGAKQRRGLRGKGPTPKAADRPYHVAAKAKTRKSTYKPERKRTDDERSERPTSDRARPSSGRSTSSRPSTGRPSASRSKRPGTDRGRPDKRGSTRPRQDRAVREKSSATYVDTIAGRNTVVEALRANIPAKELIVAIGLDVDERITEILDHARVSGLTVREVTRHQVESITGMANHQGVALIVKPYAYSSQKEIFQRAKTPALFVAVDGITDPRNIGAIVRSAAAFGADGVLIPERRNASITATAWKASAGAAARLPIAQVKNLARSIEDAKEFGCFIVGLDGESSDTVDGLKIATDSLYVIVGSEGKGLSRLVREKCDVVVSIPMRQSVESLNASVAMAIALYTIEEKRRKTN